MTGILSIPVEPNVAFWGTSSNALKVAKGSAQTFWNLETKLLFTYQGLMLVLARMRFGGEQVLQRNRFGNQCGQAVSAENVQTGGTTNKKVTINPMQPELIVKAGRYGDELPRVIGARSEFPITRSISELV